MSYYYYEKSHHNERDSHRYKRDLPMFFTYKDNLFNNYVGKRVQITIKNRRRRVHIYIGTFMAFDLHMNVVLADCYRVIRNHEECQRQDVNGLLYVRGNHLLTVNRERDEKRLRRYPKPPEGSKKNANKGLHRSESSGYASTRTPAPAATPAPTPLSTPPRPLKLKRTWKVTEPTPASPQKVPPTTQTPFHRDTPSAAAPDTVSDMVRNLKIKEEPTEEDVPAGV